MATASTSLVNLTENGACFRSSDPQAAGFDEHRLQRLYGYLDRTIRRGDVAGVNALIVRRGRLAYAASLGMRDVENRMPMCADTIFRIYSMSKPVVSVATMILLEQGEVLLSDPVRAFLPELGAMKVATSSGERSAQTADITIADLMTHTAGFTYGGDEKHPVDREWNAAKLFRRDGTIQDVIGRLATLPLKHQPGEAFEYSIAHDVLGALIERVSGMRLGDFLAAHIFGPLQMSDTAFEVTSEKMDRLSTLYGPKAGGGLEVLDPASPASRWMAPVTLQAGGEGLVSTVPDFLRFCMMLRGEGNLDDVSILSRKSVSLMTSNRLSEAQRASLWMTGYGYGLGFGVLMHPAANANLGTAGEYTWAGSASTFFWVDPKEDIIALLFAQLEPSSHLTIARQFKALMYQALV